MKHISLFNRTLVTCLTSVVLLLVCFTTTAQVKVGDNPNSIKNASLLELESTNKGLVMPRVSLTGAITSPAPLAADILPGTIVYNTNAAFIGGTGLQIWTGSTWMVITPTSLGSTDAWKLTGNSGTDPSTNFIGTTDAQPLIFKVNGQRAGYLNSSGSATSTSFGYQSLNVNTGNDNTAMGYFSMLGNTTGSGNTSFGVSSLRTNTTGSSNTANGWNSLYNNTAGNNNTAMGKGSLFNNVIGNNNTANGVNSLLNNNSDNNTAIGYSSLVNNTSGNNNTALGVGSLQTNVTGTNNSAIGNTADVTNNNLTNATAIGYKARVNISNALVLGDSTDNVNVGIGTGTPTANFHVKGTVRFAGLTNGVLTADTNGNLSTTNLSANSWGLTGNSGTNPSTNFIGTTDAQPLIFKVNNQKAGYINNNGNTAIGYQASNVGGGAFNTAMGQNTLSNNSANGNTAMGYNTLSANTNGLGNSAYGVGSLSANISGGTNTAIGFNSLNGNTSGNSNIGIGHFALSNNTSGSNNVAIGEFANVASGNLTNAIAIGANARVNISNALVLGDSTDNVTIGIGTGSPTANLHVKGTVRFAALTNGILAADANGNLSTTTLSAINSSNWSLTGNSGTNPSANFIGTTDAQPLVFKANNIQSGKIDFALSNTSFGYQSLNSTVTGDLNTAFGHQSMNRTTTGTANTAAGYGTLNYNTTGRQNTAMGSGALLYNTVGSSNTANGDAALYSNTNGNNNTASGFFALYGNTTGSSNVANGNGAGYSNSTGSFNTAYGSQALYSNTTGNNNTALGSGADVTSGNLTNATAIGANASVAISNAMVLGNGVSVGIGTSSPTQKLEVNGGSVYANGENTGFLTDNGTNARVGLIKYAGRGGGIWRTNTQQFEIGRVDASVTSLPGSPASFTTDLYVSGTGQVGVGTTGTTALLDVNGSTRLRGLTTAGVVTTDANGNLTSTAISGLVTASNGLTKAGSDIQLGGSLTKNTTIDAGATNFFAVTSNALEAPTIDQQNTTGPLVINQYSTQWQSFTCRKDGVLSSVDVGLFAYPTGVGTYNYTVEIYTGTGLGGTLIGTATVSYITTSAGSFSVSVPFSAKPALLFGGVYTIHLSSTNPGTGWFGGDDSYSGGVASVMYANYDYIFTTYMQGTSTSSGLIVKNGFVGVGASNPQHPLTIQANTGGTMLGFYNSSGTDKYNFSLTSGGLNLSESNVGGARIFVKDGGNVGIGTNTPGYKLDVNGGIRCVGAVVTTSDARLKKDIQPINSALSGVLGLRGVRYTFRRSDFPAMGLPEGQQIGLLAQEVEKIYPELVSTDAQGYKAVNYAQLAPVLIEAIKEQQKEIDSTIKQNDDLKKDVETLKAQMKILMDKMTPATQANSKPKPLYSSN